jgi:hypothetical protein
MRNADVKAELVIIIPAYNEEHNIVDVIRECRKNYADILVIDDGSTDATRERALDAGAKVMSLVHNLGIGGAMQCGYMYAKNHGYKYAVQVDADGQHNPEDIGKLLASIKKNDSLGLVIGSRFAGENGYKSTCARRIGIAILAFILLATSGKRVIDVTSGFRIASREAISIFAAHYPYDYPETESIAMLLRKGIAIEEIPIAMNERQSGRSSIRFGKTIYYMTKVSLGLILNWSRKTVGQ